MLEPDPEVVEPDTADPDVVEPEVLDAVADDVDVTTVPDAANWLAPTAEIIETSSTVAPLIKISSAAASIWNKDPKLCPDWLGTINKVNKSGANWLCTYAANSVK